MQMSLKWSWSTIHQKKLKIQRYVYMLCVWGGGVNVYGHVAMTVYVAFISYSY